MKGIDRRLHRIHRHVYSKSQTHASNKIDNFFFSSTSERERENNLMKTISHFSDWMTFQLQNCFFCTQFNYIFNLGFSFFPRSFRNHRLLVLANLVGEFIFSIFLHSKTKSQFQVLKMFYRSILNSHSFFITNIFGEHKHQRAVNLAVNFNLSEKELKFEFHFYQ